MFIYELPSVVLWNIAIFLCQPRYAVVRLPHAADGTTDGIGRRFPGRPAGLFIYNCQVDLDGSMVLGVDDAVARRALAGNVQIDVFSGLVLHGWLT
uniref:Putative 40s ribosomal protein s21 n=1 Tax=Rhipicephalus microplus TaxID=6941 RepID=A0A6G5A0Y5_RHIMP